MAKTARRPGVIPVMNNGNAPTDLPFHVEAGHALRGPGYR